MKEKKTTKNKKEKVIKTITEDQIQEPTSEELQIHKKEKTNNFWSELKSFFLIILIIGVVVGAGFLIYKFVKPIEKNNKKEETKITETNEYKTITYKASENHYIKVLDNKYILEYEDNVLFKILDLEGNVLFEGKEAFTEILIGIDEELYLTHIGASEEYDNTSISIYRFNDNELVELFTAADEGFLYTTLIYQTPDKERLIGVVGESYEYGDDESTTTSLLYTLDNQKNEVTEIRFTGDNIRLAIDQPIYTSSENYIIVKDTNSEYKYGVYDIKNNEMIVNTKYEGLYATTSGNYIAVKNKKAGLINLKSKILIDFKYDFISDADTFYITSKDKKLGIINKDFKEIIKPTFTFQQVENAGFSYQPCCGILNSFSATKYKDKYVLTINEGEINSNIKYKIHETYIIDEKGEYLTIGANEFGIDGNFIYSFDDTMKKYSIYDENFAEKYIIDISKYDFESQPYIYLVNDNTIIVSLDTELYYDYSNGEEISTIKDATFVDDKIEFRYTDSDKKVTLKVNGKEVSSYDYNPNTATEPFYKNIDNQIYYYVTDNYYVMVKKSE